MGANAGGWRAAAVVALSVSLALSGCIDGGDGDGERTGFERALASLGEGLSTGSGFGWADLEALGPPADGRWAADALGPGSDDLLEEAPQIARATGFDPGSASAAVAEGGSYAFGVRFDGAPAGRLGQLLRQAGASSRSVGEWTLYDLGAQAHGETAGPLEPLGALASRVAIGPEGVVLSRFDPARSSLIRERGVLELGDKQELAADCLGEVDAARLVPGTFTHNPAASPALIAIGVGREGDGWREIVCAIDDPERNREDRVAALERAFAPGARDEITGASIAELVASASVSGEREGELEVARAELELAPDARPGFLLGAFSRGSLLTYLGVRRPIPR